MKRLRRHPVFAVLIATLLTALVGLVVAIGVVASSNHRTRTKLSRRQHELRTFAAAGPLLSEADAILAGEENARIERRVSAALDRYRSAIESANYGSMQIPDSPADAFFELAGFAEKMSADAGNLGVKLSPGERFGFSEFRKNGPERELIPAIMRQRRAVERVLTVLFAARPERLLGVARELPISPASALAPRAQTGSGDIFVLAPEQSARVKGEIDSCALRVSFVGDTAALRRFLNALIDGDPFLLVRGVEAAPFTSEEAARSGRAEDGLSTTSVLNRRTRFTVTIEAIDFLPASGVALSS